MQPSIYEHLFRDNLLSKGCDIVGAKRDEGVVAMHETVQLSHEWNRSCWLATGVERAHLLLTVAGIGNFVLKMVPSDRVRITRINGLPNRSDASICLNLNLGESEERQVRLILVELALGSHPFGRHQVLQLEWSTWQGKSSAPSPVHTYGIEAEFVHDYNLVATSANRDVEKQVLFVETMIVLDRVLGFCREGKWYQAALILKRQLDTTLYAAIMMQDGELCREAEKLYLALRMVLRKETGRPDYQYACRAFLADSGYEEREGIV